jgi:hypothetical protein
MFQGTSSLSDLRFFREQNQIARIINASRSVGSPDNALIPIRNKNNQEAPNFPRHVRNLRSLTSAFNPAGICSSKLIDFTDAQVGMLLGFYEQTRNGNLEEKQSRFARFVGVTATGFTDI